MRHVAAFAAGVCLGASSLAAALSPALAEPDLTAAPVVRVAAPFGDPLLTRDLTPPKPRAGGSHRALGTEPNTSAPLLASPVPVGLLDKWGPIADCESGDWIDGVPVPGSRRWDYGLTFSHGDHYQGGLNFDPGTWDAYKPDGFPDHAGHATPDQQMYVAELVLADQNWQAWPTCSRMVGYR